MKITIECDCGNVHKAKLKCTEEHETDSGRKIAYCEKENIDLYGWDDGSVFYTCNKCGKEYCIEQKYS